MARSSPKKPSKVPATTGNHDDDVRSTLARLAVVLAKSPKDVTVQMELVKETWSERAAIREYLGGVTRYQAECDAISDTCSVLGVKYTQV